MSVYYCEPCGQYQDCDYVGCNEHPQTHNLVCDDCYENLYEDRQFVEWLTSDEGAAWILTDDGKHWVLNCTPDGSATICGLCGDIAFDTKTVGILGEDQQICLTCIQTIERERVEQCNREVYAEVTK